MDFFDKNLYMKWNDFTKKYFWGDLDLNFISKYELDLVNFKLKFTKDTTVFDVVFEITKACKLNGFRE